jgi:membrane associated rhomboid family serine protease/DNA-directed RNA polymerase subunit RPC12/RpoP
MADTELFVICNNCGSEVSPYVTECPYCGHRLRKRAPDLKKERKQQKKRAKKAERASAARGASLRARLGVSERRKPTPSYLASSRPPIAITVLVTISVVASLAIRVDGFPIGDILFTGNLGENWWQLFTAPFVHFGFGYAFVVLVAAAMFGSGLERRFGAIAVFVIWVLCGGAGVALENLVSPAPFTNGAVAPAVGMLAAWLAVVVVREDLRDYDSLGIAAVSAVLLALPIATDEASVWTTVGGVAAGTFCGLVLTRFKPS